MILVGVNAAVASGVIVHAIHASVLLITVLLVHLLGILLFHGVMRSLHLTGQTARRTLWWVVLLRRLRVHGSKGGVVVLCWHAHGWVYRWWGCWSVWSSRRSRVVLRSSPRESDTRITDWITLHLVDGHLSCMSLDKLHEAATLSWWNLHIGDFAESLEEGSQFILGNVTRESTDKDGRVVRVGELVHWLRGTIVSQRWHAHLHHAHLVHTTWLVLWCRSRDAHRSVAAVDALHLCKSALLVHLISKSDKSVATRDAAHRISHNLGRLARCVAALEERDEHILVDFWAQVTDEDGVLWSALIASTARLTTIRVSNLV